MLTHLFTAAGWLSWLERRSAERKVAGSIRGRTNSQGLKITEVLHLINK